MHLGYGGILTGNWVINSYIYIYIVNIV
ncbi:unnamed protein product [Spirodela intermedia]|uniref:Uncharacterized protein n=1 Tax=Spirodela intermedia TaxID=51605 RepID=A0A7I8KAP5_SPIIN|nr:unnamed protein product [Spirodela intermedia]